MRGMVSKRLSRPSIPSAENFTVTSSSNSAFTWTTTNSAYDMEISMTGQNVIKAYLRYDGNRAYCFRRWANGFTISIVEGISNTGSADAVDTYPTNVGFLYQTGTPLSTAGSPTWVFGVAGFEIYVKVNGSDVVRFKDWRHYVQGKAAMKAANGTTLTGNTATFLTPTAIYSEPSRWRFDPRDFGAKQLSTTGSISASSTSLTVASSAGFQVGDYIIVEIGGEAGAGMRGTNGVGGTWPALSYADVATMNADTSKATNTWCWVVATGDVYRWSGSAWVAQTVYNVAKALPRALQTTITAIPDSTHLTLATAATTTTTNANVYYDCAPAIKTLLNGFMYGAAGGENIMFASHPNMYVELPKAVNWAIGGSLRSYNNNGVGIRGNGSTSVLFSPDGTPCAGIDFVSVTGKEKLAYNFKIKGNMGFNKYGLSWATTPVPYHVSTSPGTTLNGLTYTMEASGTGTTTETGTVYFPQGCIATQCGYVTLEDIYSEDTAYAACGLAYCGYSYIKRPTLVMNEVPGSYIQWQYQISDSNNCELQDVTMTSVYQTGGCELFRCTDSAIRRVTSTNFIHSSNTNSNFIYEDMTCTNTAYSNAGPSLPNIGSPNNPFLNVNANIGGLDITAGGIVRRCSFTQQGYISDTSGKNDILTGIAVAGQCPNVQIANCTITSPNWSATSTNPSGVGGIGSNGANTDISSCTIVGNSQYDVSGSGSRAIHCAVNSTIASGSTITGCTAPSTYLV